MRKVNFMFRVVVSFMAQGEEGGLTVIREDVGGEEFGEMEAGSVDERLVSPLLGCALDDSLLAAQSTPNRAQMEVEIARRVDAAMARGMEAQQQYFMADALARWGDVGGYREETGFGAQFADVDVNVQGRQYGPSMAFGRAGPAMGPAPRHNPYRPVVGGQVPPAASHGDAQQQWLPMCMDASPSPHTTSHGMPMLQALRQPPFTVLAPPTTSLPSTIAADQSASIFSRLDAALQELQHLEQLHGPAFWGHYLKDERGLRTINLGEAFSMIIAYVDPNMTRLLKQCKGYSSNVSARSSMLGLLILVSLRCGRWYSPSCTSGRKRLRIRQRRPACSVLTR
jgi:hypothetical protein